MTSLLQELDRIAARVTALADIVAHLREENQAMRTTIEQRDSENRQLHERLDTARDRVETLITRMSIDG